MKSHITRFLSLALAFVLSVSLCVPAFAAEAVSFSDVQSTAWYYSDVTECARLGIVTGYADGSFLPNETVTTVQFIVMLTRTFYADEVAAVSAPAGSAWYYAYTKVASDIGLSNDLNAADINDSKGMTRYNMALVLNNTINSSGKIVPYTPSQMADAVAAIQDAQSIPTDYRMPVVMCYIHGILTGMSDGTFSGDESMTRAQACTVIVRMMNLIQGTQPAAPTTPTQPATPAAPEEPQQPAQTGTDAGVLANGKPATPENVTAMLEEIKVEYPDGYAWGTAAQTGLQYSTPSAEIRQAMTAIKCNASLQSACGGFAAMVSDTIFGNNAGTEVTNISDLRPGDVLVKYDSNGTPAHVAIVLYTKAPYTDGNNNATWRIYCASGNMNGGYVEWEHTYDVNTSRSDGVYTYRFVTRY